MTPRETWKDVRTAAFWDRDVGLEEWAAGFLSGHMSYLPQTLSSMHPRKALMFLPSDQFIAMWPEVRLLAVSRYPQLSRKISMWDGYWSLLATGTTGVKPLPPRPTLPRRAREFLLWTARHPGTSIYSAAKALEMTYKRAFDHAARLHAMGFLNKRLDTSGPRKLQRLYAFC